MLITPPPVSSSTSYPGLRTAHQKQRPQEILPLSIDFLGWLHELRAVNGLPSIKSESTAWTGKIWRKLELGRLRVQRWWVSRALGSGEKTEVLKSSNPGWTWGFLETHCLPSHLIFAKLKQWKKKNLCSYSKTRWRLFHMPLRTGNPRIRICLAPRPLELHPLVLRREQKVLGI